MENRIPKLEIPLDRFVATGPAARGLTLQPEADRATRLRRISFDLTGLPPTTAEVAAFEADSLPRYRFNYVNDRTTTFGTAFRGWSERGSLCQS